MRSDAAMSEMSAWDDGIGRIRKGCAWWEERREEERRKRG